MNIYIYYSVDQGNFVQFLISLASLVENNKNNNLTIYNFDAEISEYQHIKKISKKLSTDQIEIINKILKKYNIKNSFIEIDVSHLVKKYFFKSNTNEPLHQSGIWSVFSYNRCLLPYVKNMPNKILWLDTDTIIGKDLSDLWNIDISDYEWAGRRDITQYRKFANEKTNLRLKELLNEYPIQNGVMLLNVPKANEIFKKMIELQMKENLGPGWDTTFMNYFSKKILELPEKFNSYKYDSNNYIHHVCGTKLYNKWIFNKAFWKKSFNNREPFVPLSNIFGKEYAIKPDTVYFFKKYPQYKKYLNIISLIYPDVKTKLRRKLYGTGR
ncbi:MAG: glycosyltransferase family 8 protein [Mycoplasmoidaceae bacterium]|nr:MAG: glycosyltransferase family 8 protein [Mycoplasmoidaceae bacterium]